MANFGFGNPDRGALHLVPINPNVVEVHFEFSALTLRSAEVAEGEIAAGVKMLEFNSQTRRVTILPIGTLPIRESVGRPKYQQLRRINVPMNGRALPDDEEEVLAFLEQLPRGLTKDPQFGLGLPREYRLIVDAIESHTSCAELFLTSDESRGVVGEQFVVSYQDFENIRAMLDRIVGRAATASLNVRAAHSQNWVAGLIGAEEVAYKRGQNSMIQAFADAAAGNEALPEDELDDLLRVMRSQSRAIATARPEALAKLRRDIEMVELDDLIDRFRGMLDGSHSEAAWQQFLSTNPFVLSFAYNYPLIVVHDQASVGGRKLTGGGEKIADFIAKNPTTDNVALFEIKTPKTPLLQAAQYRAGIHAASPELNGAIVQALDQRYQFTKDVATIKNNSRRFDLESFAVVACLVIGRSPHDPDQAKSFELLRHALVGVEIVTFDELLLRVETLREFLAGSVQSSS